MDGAKTGPITNATLLLLPRGYWGASGHHPKTLGSQSWHFPSLLLRGELGLGLSFGIRPHLKWSCPKRDPPKSSPCLQLIPLVHQPRTPGLVGLDPGGEGPRGALLCAGDPGGDWGCPLGSACPATGGVTC